jgi:MFS family permease
MTSASDVASAGPRQEPQAAPAVRTAWREPQFLRYLLGQTASGLGDQVWYVALSWTAVHVGSPAVAGLLLTLSSVPRLALMLFGGVIADRFDIRRLMMGSDILRTVVVFGAAGIALLRPGIPLLAVLALTFGIVDAVFMPAAGAMQPRLLQPAQYSSGAAAAETLGRLALSVGAPLGGVLVAFGGLPLALAVDGATFAVSVLTLATVRPRPVERSDTTASDDNSLAADAISAGAISADGSGDPGDGSRGAADGARLLPLVRDYWSDLRTGVAFLVHHPLLAPLTALGLLSNLAFVGPMNIGLAELAAQRGWHATGIGVLLTGFGIGAAGGAVLTNWWHIRRGAGIAVAVLGVAPGAAILGMGLAPDLWLAVLAAACVGLCSGPMGVTASVLVQAATPDELRGRVNSFMTMSTYGVVLLAMAGTGVLIGATGLVGGFAICAGIEAAGVLLLLSPGLRRAGIEH